MANGGFDVSELNKYSESLNRAMMYASALKTQMEALEKAGQKGGDLYRNYSNELKKCEASIVKLRVSAEPYKKLQRELSDIFPRLTKNTKIFEDVIKNLSDEYKESTEAAIEMADMTKDQYNKMLESAEQYKKALEKMTGEPVEWKMKTRKEIKQEARLGLTEKVGGKARGALGSLGGVLGMKPAVLGKAAGAFDKVWDNAKKVGPAFKGVAKELSIAGNGAGMFMGALNLLGKALLANPIGLLVGSLAAVMTVVNDLDKMIKGLNKSWREMAGSPVLLKNIRGSMKEFNDSLFVVSRNMRLGIKAGDAQDFFKALTATGVSLEGVKSRVGDYNTVIEAAFTNSRMFGVSFNEMGTMMGDQMMNLRSSLDDVTNAFKTMSYDAAVAGVSSQKFYQVVENASMGLSFYGNYLKAASGMLRKFSDTGVMGFKDASDTVATLLGTIKGMGSESRMQLISVLDPKNVQSMFGKYLDETDKQIDDQTKKIEKLQGRKGRTEAEEDQLKAAKDQLEAMKGNRALVRERLQTGDITGLQSVLDVLSDKVPEMAFDYLRNVHVDPFKDVLATQKLLQQMFRWNEDMANKVMKKATIVMDNFRNNMGDLTSAFQGASDKSKIDELGAKVKKFFEDPTSSPFKTMDDMMAEARKVLSEQGFKGTALESAMDLIKDGGSVFLDMAHDIQVGTMTLAKAQDYAIKIAAAKVPALEGDMKDEQLQDLIKQTTPIADYLEIGAEGVKYALASGDIQNTIALATTQTARYAGDIISWLTKKVKEPKGETERYKEIYSAKMRLEKEAQALEKAGKKDEAKRVRKSLKDTEVALKEQEKRLSTMPHVLRRVREEVEGDATLSGEKYLQNVKEIRERESEMQEKRSEDFVDQKTYDEWMKSTQARIDLLKQENKVSEERALTYKPETALKMAGTATGAAIGAAIPGLEFLTIPLFGMLGEWLAKKGGRSLEQGMVPDVEAAAKKEAEEKKDFLASRGGWVKVSAGDLVLDSLSMAKGMGAGRGQLMGYGRGIMRNDQRSSSIGPIYLNFNAPLSGKPEDYQKVFVQAMNDIVNRRLYEEKMRTK